MEDFRKDWNGKKKGQRCKEKAHMARKGNPISVSKDLEQVKEMLKGLPQVQEKDKDKDTPRPLEHKFSMRLRSAIKKFFAVIISIFALNYNKMKILLVPLFRPSLFLLALFLSHSLGSERIAKSGNFVIFGIFLLLVGFNFLFCLFFSRLKKKYGLTLVKIIEGCLFLLFLLWLSFFRSYALSILSSLVIFGMASGGGQGLPLPAPSGPSSSSCRDSFALDVLLEPWPNSPSTGSTETGTSVNQPEAGPVPPGGSATGDFLGPSSVGNSAQSSLDPDPVVLQKKEDLHLLFREQLRHYCERGLPKWRLSGSSESQTQLYSESARHIIQSLEVEPSDLQLWIDRLRSNPETLSVLYKEYK